MHQEARTEPIEKIVVHVNVGPEVENGAQSLLGYLQKIDGGYHAICDDQHTVTAAADNVVVWGAGGMNDRGLHVCMIGFADQTPLQWTDPYSNGAVEQAAQWVAQKCRQYAIPVVRLSPAQVATDGVKGICGHVDVSAVFAASQGHYDPGPNFPWTPFLARVAAIISPPVPPPDPAVVKSLGALAAFIKAVTTKPIRLGNSGRNVKLVQGLLNKHGFSLALNGVYGADMATAVRRFKVAHGLKNLNPDAVGRACLLALLKAK